MRISETPIIGITGGSGAGKSVVIDRLEELGAVALRADGIYHSLLLSDAEMLRELTDRLPGAFNSDGTFSREKMRGIVFSDKEALSALNRIAHPYVLKEIEREIERAVSDGEKAAAVEAIDLIGSELDARCTWKIAVIAPVEIRLARIILRDGLSREDALARIQSQNTDEYYMSHCNIILENNGSTKELIEGVDKFWRINVRN
jgi:dephospho-CoA kinase